MITHTGTHVTPDNNGVPSERDLAVGMCRITRYAGSIWCPLAPHSILVAEYCAMEAGTELAWAHGMLHDAHECVTGELTRWWKPSSMKEFERDLDVRILRYFGLEPYRHAELHPLIKRADEKALCAEATILGLPGWADFYRKEGGTPPTLSDSERTVAEQLLWGIWRDPEMVQHASRQADILTEVFWHLKVGSHAEARALVSPICVVPEE